MGALYDDGRIVCDDDGLRIGWHYLWGPQRIPYRDIRSIRVFELSPVRGRWRLWGSGDLVHWYNLDASRPSKRRGIEIDKGGTVRPRITPDDVDKVAAILNAHLVGAGT